LIGVPVGAGAELDDPLLVLEDEPVPAFDLLLPQAATRPIASTPTAAKHPARVSVVVDLDTSKPPV